MSSLLALLLILPNNSCLSPPPTHTQRYRVTLSCIGDHLWVQIPTDASKGVALSLLEFEPWSSIVQSNFIGGKSHPWVPLTY